MAKLRLDLLMTQNGLATGRDTAKALIMAGQVYVAGQKADKPGMQVPGDCLIEVRGETPRYVSRGGLKLERALEAFPITLQGKLCVDIGASTGGFTDCMLQNGASKVYAVDVGYGQLAWKLREDPRVEVLERTNIRYVTEEQIPVPADFVSVDVSFISLSLVLPVIARLLSSSGEAVCLIKPQFEAGRGKVGKKGVVREPETHIEVIAKVLDFAVNNGFSVLGLTYSPVKGPQGNIEYLLYIGKASGGNVPDGDEISELVERSHRELS
jgi:23S rRNA (cytidine1920-2'-O)/16S rRNA (cytidine1409-2'-O)-methyltransferase